MIGKTIQLPALLLLAFFISGCANLTGRDGPPAPVVEAGRQTPSGTQTETQAVVPAVRGNTPLQRSPLPESGGSADLPPATPTAALLADVNAALAAGELERAAALCERALRISPREGLLWYRLAEIRYRQGRYEEALGFAQRAQSLAAADAALLRESIRLQELSRAAAGR